MKAAIYKKYGGPEVIFLGERPKPSVRPNEVLIQISYSTVNRTDCGFRSSKNFISRLFSGLFSPRNPVLGCEFSGEIIGKGASVTLFNIGDQVFGYDDENFGGHAEFKAIHEKKNIVRIPQGIDLKTAAAITEGSHYALSAIQAVKIKKTDTVLVNGATGAIGSAAVQILKYFGAHVVAVGNERNLELVYQLGADTVINYEKEDFLNTSEKFEFIFDAVGKSSFKACKKLLKDRGIYISTELGKNSINIFLAMISVFSKRKRVLFPIPVMNAKNLDFLQTLVKDHHFKPVIDREYRLDEIVQAYEYVEKGEKTGNVIVQID